MALRDFLIAPREAARPDEALARGRLRLGRPRRPEDAALVASLGVLANARDLPAIAVAAGIVIARRSPAALVCLHAAGGERSTAPLRAPARAAPARLAASLRARGLAADARGRIAAVELAGDGSDAAAAAARALAAAGTLPTVIGVAVRDPDMDGLLAAQDAILVALPPSTDAALAELTVASAARLGRVASIPVTLDPASRALAVAGLRAPRLMRAAVEELLS
jgi:hypothetical protein